MNSSFQVFDFQSELKDWKSPLRLKCIIVVEFSMIGERVCIRIGRLK